MELAVERSLLTGMPPDRVSGSIAAFDFLYLSELGRRGVVAPSVARRREASEPQAGGHVLEPMPGLYANVVVLDFKSLYPSLIRTFEIDPLNLVRAGAGHGTPIHRGARTAPPSARGKASCRALLDDLIPRREAARRAGDQVKSHAIKILMNSFYGVLGTPACRFYDPRLANAITSFGRELLLWCKRPIEARRPPRALRRHRQPVRRVGRGRRRRPRARAADARRARSTASWPRTSRERWRVESRLELEFERLYLRLCLPAMRHDAAGARKRYAGLVEESGGTRVIFTGMEAVRRDWTALAKEVQRELYARLFADRAGRGLPARRRGPPARRRARRPARLPQGAAQARPRPTPPPLRPTSPRRASWAGAARPHRLRHDHGRARARGRAHGPARLRALRRQAGGRGGGAGAGPAGPGARRDPRGMPKQLRLFGPPG